MGLVSVQNSSSDLIHIAGTDSFLIDAQGLNAWQANVLETRIDARR